VTLDKKWRPVRLKIFLCGSFFLHLCSNAIIKRVCIAKNQPQNLHNKGIKITSKNLWRTHFEPFVCNTKSLNKISVDACWTNCLSVSVSKCIKVRTGGFNEQRKRKWTMWLSAYAMKVYSFYPRLINTNRPSIVWMENRWNSNSEKNYKLYHELVNLKSRKYQGYLASKTSTFMYLAALSSFLPYSVIKSSWITEKNLKHYYHSVKFKFLLNDFKFTFG